MDNNEFKFAIDNMIDELSDIEEREKKRREEIKRLKEELKKRKDELREESRKNFMRSAWIETALMAVPTLIILFAINLIVRYKMGIAIDNVETGVRESIGVLPIIPIVIGYFFFITWKSNKMGRELCKALENASQGNFEIRLDPFGKGPFREAYKDYNEMCERLDEITKDLNTAVRLANEANDAKSHFLSNMSHEIRTPINAVLGLDEMIIRESGEEQIVSYAQDIRSAGKSLLGLINDILDFSKIESGKLELIYDNYDLSSLINDLLNMNLKKAQDKGLSIIMKINPELPHLLYGDELRLKQIILNILSNAIKYTDHGHITVTMDYTKKDDESIILYVSIKDTGKGIKEEDLAKLFTPFERIEEKRNKTIEGTGLGMSITKQLLSMMHSQLMVDSIYGEGSDFHFEVEQKVRDFEGIGNFEEAYKKLKEEESHYHESFKAPNARVMVVDDTTMNLTVFKGLLKQTELQIDACESGAKCLELCRTNDYQLIFVDYMMPDMDGIETLRHIRNDEDSLNSTTPVVVLTANAVSGAKEGYLKEGFSDYLSKPIDSQLLEKMIMKFLPEELMTVCKVENNTGNEETEENPIVAQLDSFSEIDAREGIKATGGVDLYIKVAKEFSETGETRAGAIAEYYEAGDLRNYSIQVHALKSSARLLGATDISERAKFLEECGNAENTEKILELTPGLLSDYRGLAEKMKDIFASKEELPLIDEASLMDAVQCLSEVVEAFDFDSADSIMERLSAYSFPDSFKDTYEKLKVLMAEVARDDIINLLKEHING